MSSHARLDSLGIHKLCRPGGDTGQVFHPATRTVDQPHFNYPNAARPADHAGKHPDPPPGRATASPSSSNDDEGRGGESTMKSDTKSRRDRAGVGGCRALVVVCSTCRFDSVPQLTSLSMHGSIFLLCQSFHFHSPAKLNVRRVCLKFTR